MTAKLAEVAREREGAVMRVLPRRDMKPDTGSRALGPCNLCISARLNRTWRREHLASIWLLEVVG